MIVAGIDPGTHKTGYGIVRREGTRFKRVISGTIVTNPKNPLADRLHKIYNELDSILIEHNPDEAAVEDIFFAKNASSALKLGHVRGVILLAIKNRQIPFGSYPPAVVKKAIVGSGRAAKGQMQKIVQAILGLSKKPMEDEGDALGIAICHLNSMIRNGYKR